MTAADISFQIFVTQLPCDDVCTLRNVTGETFVYELKSRVEIKTGIPANIFRLFFMNRELFDQATLSDYKPLQNGCIVRMKLEPSWNDLIEACRRGDIYEVFENGVQFLDPNQFEGCNISLWNKLVIQRASLALFVACHRGYLGLVLELLNHSAADINGKTVFGRTALHAAAYQGFVGCVSLLLSEGALCNQIDSSGKTPLSLASENGHVYCEKRLWLYQCSLRSGFPRTNSSGSSQVSQHSGNNLKLAVDRERRHGTGRVPSNSPTESVRDSDSREGRKELHFRLPRVGDAIIMDNKHLHKTKRTKSAQPNQIPFPLVQLAEQYHQEFQEYQNQNLPPAHAVKEHRASGASPKRADSEHSREIKKTVRGTVPKEELKIEPNAAENLRKHQGGVAALQEEAKNAAEKRGSNNNSCLKSLKSTNPAKEGQEAVDMIGNRSMAGDDKKSSPRKANGALRKLSLVMAQDLSRSADVRQDPVTMVAEYSDPKTEAFSIEASPIKLDAPEDTYPKHRAVMTFETWLETKRARGKLTLRPATAPVKMNRSFGKSIDPECFKKWLDSKKGNRSRTTSESRNSTQKRTFISTGMTFERWLEFKKGKGTEGNVGNMAESSRDSSGGKSVRVRVPSVGKSFEEWLQEKKQEISASRDDDQDDRKSDKYASRSGKPFHVWLEEKERAKKIDMIHKATLQSEEERRQEMMQFRRWIDPHYRTFDEWLMLKNEELVLERVRSHNEPKERREISVQEKEEDARIVFGIWLTMKAVQEYDEEEKKYEEMKAKWAVKDKEREYRKRRKRWTT